MASFDLTNNVLREILGYLPPKMDGMSDDYLSLSAFALNSMNMGDPVLRKNGRVLWRALLRRATCDPVTDRELATGVANVPEPPIAGPSTVLPHPGPPVAGPSTVRLPYRDPPVAGPSTVRLPHRDPPVAGPSTVRLPHRDPSVAGPSTVLPHPDPPVAGPSTVPPQHTAPGGDNRRLDALDIVITRDDAQVTCSWGACNATMLGGTYKAHFKSHHSAGRVSEDARCQWAGCRSKPMKAGSLARHVLDVHLQMHGPARLCRKTPRAATTSPSGSTPDVDERPPKRQATASDVLAPVAGPPLAGPSRIVPPPVPEAVDPWVAEVPTGWIRFSPPPLPRAALPDILATVQAVAAPGPQPLNGHTAHSSAPWLDDKENVPAAVDEGPRSAAVAAEKAPADPEEDPEPSLDFDDSEYINWIQ
ncbi:hypothetical protein C2E23DRAFT_882865 [Lenzites betulinus]|nr:hypothetical protein C2E23DRAFT_882865 [Lenzites betulinus]